VERLPVGVHVLAAGSYSSLVAYRSTAPPRPPVTRTFPFGSSAAVWSVRSVERLPVGDQTPVTTFSGTVAVNDPNDVVIVVEPSDTPATRPVVGPTVATDGVADDHFTRLVRFAVVASE